MANERFKTKQTQRFKGFCKRVEQGSKISKQNFHGGNFRIVHKALDKYASCTIYGFCYDARKIKKEWLG